MLGKTRKNHEKRLSTFRKFWCLLACRKFWCSSACKTSTSSLTTFLRYRKDITCCYFEYFGDAWLQPSVTIVPGFWILWCLSVQKPTSSFEYFRRVLIASTYKKVCLFACKKSTSCLLSVLRYWKDTASVLLWVLLACLAMVSKNDGICFKETLMLIFMQKINLSLTSFLPRYSKIITLGILSMPGYPHQNHRIFL